MRPIRPTPRFAFVALAAVAACSVDQAAGPLDGSDGLLAVAAASHHDLGVSAVKAPVASDGTTAGAPTDIVLTFMDRNPAVDGIGIKAGGTIQIELPDGFVNTGAGPNIGVILQGWPQSPPAPPPLFPWTTTVAGNTITITTTADFLPGMFGPGPKQAHLILFGFDNPKPGRYTVSLTIRPDPAVGHTLSGLATVDIIPKSRPSVQAVSLFSGAPGTPPPFNNPIYQDVALGSASLPVGLYLWDARSVPFLGVDVHMENAGHGRLVQDGRAVGHVWIDAPRGASSFELTTQGLSTQVPAFVTGQPVGLLLIGFIPDASVAGDYRITFQMNNGNSETLFLSAR